MENNFTKSGLMATMGIMFMGKKLAISHFTGKKRGESGNYLLPPSF